MTVERASLEGPGTGALSARHARMVCLFVYGVVLLLMLMPMRGSGEGASIPHLDKLVHAVAWAMLALGTWPVVAVSRRTRGWSVRARFLLVVGLGALFGVLVELVQGLVPSRSADPWDALADTLGAALGALFCLWRERRRVARRAREPADTPAMDKARDLGGT